MNGSQDRKPPRLSESDGRPNPVFESDTYIEPVMIDDKQRHQQVDTNQNGGTFITGSQKDNPAVLQVNTENNGYTDLDNTHLYQDLKPNGDSNSKPTQKNGHSSRSHDYVYGGGEASVHEYDYPDVSTMNGNQNERRINRQESNAFKGQTEQERTKKEKTSHWSRICAVFVAVLILIIIGAIIFVVFEFIVNKAEDVTTTQSLPTTATPSAQMYLVTTSAIASLDLVYTPALADPNTAEYQELETNFTNSMDAAFQNTDMPGVTYEEVNVNSFSSGSVVVNFQIVAIHTQNTPPSQAAEEAAKSAVETEVAAVLTALTEDNSSNLPLTTFNLTGSDAEIIIPSTTQSATTQQPTEITTTETASIATTSPTTTTLHCCSPFITPTVTTDTPTTSVTPSSAQTTPNDVTTPLIVTPSIPSTTRTLVTTDNPTTVATPSSARTTPSSAQTTPNDVTTPLIVTTSIPSTTRTLVTTDNPTTVATPSSAQTTPSSAKTTPNDVTTPLISTTDLSGCQPGETVCVDGVGCVGFDQFCDGIEQCLDGSDELSCTPGITCNGTDLACADQTECYPFGKTCDDVFDCTDGSDESFCSSCDESTCDNGDCYPFTGYCDGNADCTDGSDEQFCSSCDESICTNGDCYPFSGLCDGNADCTDGSDEEFCSSCGTNEIACLDGSGCYAYPDEQCDGISQCTSGEDELYCTGVCSPDELACATGNQCYNASYQCDGYQDCRDQSDEQNCTSELIVVNLADLTGPYYLSSPNYPNQYPLNANQSWLFTAASGYRPRVDISDMYTEPKRDYLSFYSANGPTGQPLVLSGAMTRSGIISYRSVSENLYAMFISDNAVSVRGFSAGVTQELASDMLCDPSQYDCNDGMVCMPTDKTCSCPVPPPNCNPPTDCFSCDSGKCIPFEEECDGEHQCAFGEDERNCMERCNSFLCNDEICVANSTVCDNKNDCTGGEDETGCTYPVGEETVDLFYGDIPYPLTSYGYPAEYPNNVNYNWKFIAGAGYKIRIQFDLFSTHDANDHIIIGNGDVMGTDPFLRLYGGGFVPEEILSQGGDIWITMVTDRSFVSIGFLANVTSVLASEVLGSCAPSDMRCGDLVCIPAERLCDVTPHCVLSNFNPGCPARINLAGNSLQYQPVTSPFLTLYSGNYPARYDEDINATIYLTAPAGQRILAATRKFDTEEDYDFLTFYEGHSTSSNDLIERLSGLVPNQIYTSTGNQMTIVFQSDYAYNFYGFWIEVEGQSADGLCSSDEFACMNGQCRAANRLCDGEIDCIDFSDEDKCPTCEAVPSQCSSVLPWSTTVFPNARYQSEADALQRYNELQSAALSCSPSSGQLLLCAALFPECPHYGTTRNMCPSVCDDVIADCPGLSELSDACSGTTVVDANNGNPICEARNGDSLNTMVCGTRPAYQGDEEVQPRIIGGTYAEMGEFPWIGSLRTRQGDLQCGATLLNEYWAVTAAHCTGFYDEIVFGDLKIDTTSSNSVSPAIAETIDHPNYLSTSGGDDITLIRFAEPVVFTDHVRPICLPTTTTVSETQRYRRCYAAGWGTLEFEGYASNELQKVLLGLLENDACGKSYNDIIPSKVCAGYPTGGYDACQGDSGGPLACEGDDGRWHLVGITSYGNVGCGDPGFPGVYTRVSSFLDFIENNTRP